MSPIRRELLRSRRRFLRVRCGGPSWGCRCLDCTRWPRRQRRHNLAEADAFFARPRSEAELSRVRSEGETPRELLAAWERDSRRARAAHHLATQGEELARLHAELARLEKRHVSAARAERQVEEARLDAIGRQVNDRLRLRERRSAQTGDTTAPHPYLTQHNQTGLQR